MKAVDTLTEFIKQMFNKLLTVLSKNLSWKVFSLLIAILLWFTVINITNPKEVWPFTVRLAFEGEEVLAENQNVVIRNQKAIENTPVYVKIRGNRLDLEALNKARSELIASANLGVIYDFSLTNDVLSPIDIKFPQLNGVSSDAFEVISISPQYAKITLEAVMTEERPIKVMTKGEVKEGYVVLTPEVLPGTVKITGPQSRLKLIESVAVEITLDGETSDFSVTLPIKLLDRDLKEVDGVTCDTSMADVNIQINKYKKVPVFATYVGEPPLGYVVTGIEWSPHELELVGRDTEIDSFKEVRLSPVNVSGLTETNSMSFDVRNLKILPENISIKNGSPNTVTIQVTIEKIVDKQLILPISLLKTSNMSNSYSYNIDDSAITINVRGVESTISELNDENIMLSADFQNYGPGEYIVPVATTLPVGITLSGEEPSVRLRVGNAAQPQTPAAQTPIPTENPATNRNEGETNG